MTKVELLAALASKYYKVMEPILKGEENGIRKYVVTTYKLDGESLNSINISFFVEDEGGPAESAFWHGAEPEGPPSFYQEVLTYITSKVNDGTIEAAFIESSSEEDQTAVGPAFVISGGSVVEKKVLVDKDQGNLRHRLIS